MYRRISYGRFFVRTFCGSTATRMVELSASARRRQSRAGLSRTWHQPSMQPPARRRLAAHPRCCRNVRNGATPEGARRHALRRGGCCGFSRMPPEAGIEAAHRAPRLAATARGADVRPPAARVADRPNGQDVEDQSFARKCGGRCHGSCPNYLAADSCSGITKQMKLQEGQHQSWSVRKRKPAKKAGFLTGCTRQLGVAPSYLAIVISEMSLAELS